MASIGLKSFKYGKFKDDGTYEAPATLAGAIECKCDVEFRDGELYYDDIKQDELNEFKSAKLTLGIADDDDTIMASLLGNTTKALTTPETSTEVTQNATDEPEYVGFGHVVPKRVNKVTKYKVEFFPKVKFKPYGLEAKTKGSSLEFTTPSIEGTVFALDDGTWEKHATFATETAAQTYLTSCFPTTKA